MTFWRRSWSSPRPLEGCKGRREPSRTRQSFTGRPVNGSILGVGGRAGTTGSTLALARGLAVPGKGAGFTAGGEIADADADAVGAGALGMGAGSRGRAGSMVGRGAVGRGALIAGAGVLGGGEGRAAR